ncbi:hypothetical protein PRIPAC_82133 [Pristionchus pacificus]|uniref:Uncharacterized protein n=1 Tax=Pristionchus pacificus TaxID=54126 RepID=A0A2A6CND7_PRIPA|nr:hypothetical protein PRIPAC_82133 [Pristionchus pacificus]|eukprot:PDM79541.1 hypothetical protein PRIPAC_32120 [Pristionchus pacificus]
MAIPLRSLLLLLLGLHSASAFGFSCNELKYFSTNPYTNWDVDEPSTADVAKCAYVDKDTPNLAWGAGNCQIGFPYMCQYAPCSVGNKDC